jgi:hypothetical protein
LLPADTTTAAAAASAFLSSSSSASAPLSPSAPSSSSSSSVIDYNALVRAGFQSYDETDVGVEYLAGRAAARREKAAAAAAEAAKQAAEEQRRQEEVSAHEAAVRKKIQLWAAEEATIRRVFHNDDGETVTKGRPSQRMQRNQDRFGKQDPVARPQPPRPPPSRKQKHKRPGGAVAATAAFGKKPRQ